MCKQYEKLFFILDSKQFLLQLATPGDEEAKTSIEIQEKNEQDAMEDFRLRLRKELVSRDGHG